MTGMVRQQALLVAEAWQNLYANQPYIDFQSYTQDNLVNAILNYVQVNYPDDFNDWITNSEFIIKVRTLAWLHQNLSYRIDLNVRENFVQTATRRSSILMLAENVFYKPNRVTGANGELRISSISTNQPLVDSNNVKLANVQINWSDPANVDWFEQFIQIINNALTPRTQFGHPLVRVNTPPTRLDLYMFNSRAPTGGTYPFNAQVAGTPLQFEYINVTVDPTTGVVSEIPPNPINALRVLYRADGLGANSPGTGFFVPIQQGKLTSLSQSFSVPQALQSVTLGVANINNGNSIFVQQLDTAGNVILNWTEVDTLYGRGTAFNTLSSEIQSIYETHTLVNDQVEVQFGDGKFGAIPTDNFQFWYRTVNPIPLVVNPQDIQNQTFVLPYVANNTLYFLTIRASLVAPITNALPTDSNQAILGALGGSFAAQQRMVTGGDYNLFPLSDPSILKLKAINRTYSGHSAYSKICDPTGYYSGVKLLGEDGRLYREVSETSNFISGSTSAVTLDEIVQQYLTPLLQSKDKEALYYEEYPEILCTGDPTWMQTSQVNRISFGNVQKAGVNIPVGVTALDEFQYCVQGTILRYDNLNGSLITVDQVVADGTGVDGIELTDALASGAVLFSLMPPLRNQFTTDEVTLITANLSNLQDFAIGWNQVEQAWVIIQNSNINKTNSFSLDFQGNSTNTGKDGSWLVYFHYLPNDGQPEWQIVDRGVQTFFESARDIHFVYVNSKPVVDPLTGKMVEDNVNILGVNEGRDSLPRLGLTSVLGNTCCPLIYEFTADGIRTCFAIRQRLTAPDLVVLVNNRLVIAATDFTVTIGPTGDNICFPTPPAAGTTISIRISPNYVYATQTLVDVLASGTSTFYTIGNTKVSADNTRLALDGILQHPGDYTTAMQGGHAGFLIIPPLRSATRVYGYAASELLPDVFTVSLASGDNTSVSFDISSENADVNQVLVWSDGVWQAPGLDYVVDNVTHAPATFITFVSPPLTGALITIYAATDPQLFRSLLFNAIGDGGTTQFVLPGFATVTAPCVMVGLDGVVQRIPDYTISATGVTFAVAPRAGQRISIFVLFAALGINPTLVNNSGGISNDNFTTWLIADSIWDCVGLKLTPDGYTDINGIQVAPVDANHDGAPDDPYEFDGVLIPDGVTDLVLWRSVIQDGFAIWSPVDQTTLPRGSYGFSAKTGITQGVTFNSNASAAGDVHFDQTSGLWLIADAVSGDWIAAPHQDDYKSATGRSGLKFIWTHYPLDNTRIDPSISNIIDMFVLSIAYDTAYRAWIQSGFVGSQPTTPTSQSLQISYAYLNAYKMTDDALVFHPINYKPLFGSIAESDLQSNFLAIQSVGSTISQNDLTLRIINAIDLFFAAENWGLGENFYFTEMVAFIHRACAPDLQSLVVVSKNGGRFGELFQVRAEPDELFISVAQPTDIQIVDSFTNENLQLD
jgi:hypothetical protein